MTRLHTFHLHNLQNTLSHLIPPKRTQFLHHTDAWVAAYVTINLAIDVVIFARYAFLY